MSISVLQRDLWQFPHMHVTSHAYYVAVQSVVVHADCWFYPCLDSCHVHKAVSQHLIKVKVTELVVLSITLWCVYSLWTTIEVPQPGKHRETIVWDVTSGLSHGNRLH